MHLCNCASSTVSTVFLEKRFKYSPLLKRKVIDIYILKEIPLLEFSVRPHRCIHSVSLICLAILLYYDKSDSSGHHSVNPRRSPSPRRSPGGKRHKDSRSPTPKSVSPRRSYSRSPPPRKSDAQVSSLFVSQIYTKITMY